MPRQEGTAMENGGSRHQRFHDLDALRAFLIMYGVLVHSATISEHWLLRTIIVSSGLFRMEAFFLLSGFFGALQLSRMPRSAFWENRLLALGVPLVVVLATTSAITNYLIHGFRHGLLPVQEYYRLVASGSEQAFFIWHLHLWFLFCLIAYALTAPLVINLVKRGVGYLERGLAVFGPLLLFAALAFAVVGCRVLHDLTIKPVLGEGPFSFIVRATFTYFPYYVLGLTVFHAKAIRNWLETREYLSFLIPLALYLSYRMLALESLPGRIDGVVRLALETLVALGTTKLLWLFARRFFAGESAWIRFGAESAYTVYLLHYLFIAIAANLFVMPDELVLWRFLAIVLFAAGATLLLHKFVVGRSPGVSFLLNGKRPRRGATAIPPAGIATGRRESG